MISKLENLGSAILQMLMNSRLLVVHSTNSKAS